MSSALYSKSVDRFAERAAAAVDMGACPLETWAVDLRRWVDHQAAILASMHQMPHAEARGMAKAGLIAGRPGSWEAAEVIYLVLADFEPLVQMPIVTPQELAQTVGRWAQHQIDGGQVLLDALRRLDSRKPVIPRGSRFRMTKLGLSVP